jgi:hypothetical protein
MNSSDEGLLIRKRRTGASDMNYAETTAAFLGVIDSKTRAAILSNIAQHYGITSTEAYVEVTSCEAEPLLDYVTGPERAATSLLLRRHGLVGIDLDAVKRTPRVVLRVMGDPSDRNYLGRLVSRGFPVGVEHDHAPGAPSMNVWGPGAVVSGWVFDNHVWSHTAVAAYTY